MLSFIKLSNNYRFLYTIRMHENSARKYGRFYKEAEILKKLYLT
ncbi:hypothetical protein LEP1GSC132_2029 [Leptospira kirschneri str. 200803703]|nr:hypothetical protein LEP1GSC132_2029 [Leptospira kirschneri str. 200803703]